MKLFEIIEPSSVCVLNGITSKKRLFQAISNISSPKCTVRQDVIVQALMERENLGPTGVGRGVALPHARLKQTNSVIGFFAKLDKPIDFGAADRQPVDLVFTLFAPENSGVAHLKALAAVSRTMRDPSICEKLRANNDASTLYEVLISEAMSSIAA